MDSDIDVKPFMRLHEGQPQRKYHRFQHFYWVVLYAISYLVWIFYDDFVKYFSGKVSKNSARKEIPLREHFIFWITKLVYVTFYIVLPVIVVGWMPWLIGFLIVTLVCGLSISIVFQLAHVVEGTQFHQPVGGGDKQEWAVHQVVSTANFATSSRVLHWLLGGLNFQVEHHLFPRISHIHYPAINEYVKETCREFNIAYNEYNTMFTAIASHLRYLHMMGRNTAQLARVS
jgi:linoleoyl-CoA desaturase